VTSYGAALASARGALKAEGIASAALDARLLMADAAGVDMATLIARADDRLPALAEASFAAHLRRRLDGEPVARILGEKEFWGLRFRLNAATLVPRPETETLVEAVIAEARRRFPPGIAICDLGTGSGAILIALLTELPDARGIGTDLSENALGAARQNADRLGVAERIRFRRADFATAPDGPFDVVVSNPPYVPSAAIAALDREVRDHDPRLALDGGADGLAAYRTILARADRLLAEGGLLAFEVGHDQGDAVAALCAAAGFSAVAVHNDLGGTGRVVAATWSVLESRRSASKISLGKVSVSG
jgi:release factor glutamine methyltransferase